jgi:hypothetical protein
MVSSLRGKIVEDWAGMNKMGVRAPHEDQTALLRNEIVVAMRQLELLRPTF